MNYKPFGSGVLLEMPFIAETTEAGIIKGEQAIAEEKADWDGTYRVLAIGVDCRYAKINDKVYLRPNVVADEMPLKAGKRKVCQVDEFALLGKYEKSTIKPTLN